MTKSTRRSIGNRQLDTLQRVSTLFAAEPQAAIAKKIASLTLGGQLTESLFTNGGTEANETDIRSARLFHGKHRDRGAPPRLSWPHRHRR